jgi:hypothetical protein
VFHVHGVGYLAIPFSFDVFLFEIILSIISVRVF